MQLMSIFCCKIGSHEEPLLKETQGIEDVRTHREVQGPIGVQGLVTKGYSGGGK